MGDFESVFGVGADFDSIVDSFSRSADIEAEREAEERSRFHAWIFLHARIEASNFSLYLESYKAVMEFDKAATDLDGTIDFAFKRQREGSGYRVTIDRDRYRTCFTKPGRIIVAKYHEAWLLSTQSGPRVFELDGPIFKWDDYDHFLEARTHPIFASLDAGQDVIVHGSYLSNILESRVRFVGWSQDGGFSPIFDWQTLNSYSSW